MREGTATGRDSADLAATNYTTFLDLRATTDGKVTCDTTITVSSMTDCTWTAYGSRTVSAAATELWLNGQKMTGKVTTTSSAALVRWCRFICSTATSLRTGHGTARSRIGSMAAIPTTDSARRSSSAWAV